MASGSPSRSRIDQFFTSKKRKALSPHSKPGRNGKDTRTIVDGSPNAKGRLDSYLVTSPNDKNLDKPSFDAHNSLAWKDQVKRNLSASLEISSSLKDESCGLILSSKCKTAGMVEGNCEEKTCERLPEMAGQVDAGSDAGKSGSSHVQQNSELKKFASDFLSLYCSEISADVHSLSELKVNNHKREGSPLPLDEPKKRHLVADLSDGQGCKGTSYNRVSCEDTPSTSACRTKGNNASGLQPTMNKCSNIPKPSVEMTELNTPGSLTAKVSFCKTPKSAHGSSIFSPGEAFWNEAIQLADGLCNPVVNVVAESGVKDQNHSKKGLEEKSSFPVKHFDFSFEDKKMDSTVVLLGDPSDLKSSNQGVGASSELSQVEIGNCCRNSERDREECRVQEIALFSVMNKRSMDSVSKDNQNDVPTVGIRAPIGNHESGEATPSSRMPSKDWLDLKCWLPSEICSIYKKKGIIKLYPWQVDCLRVEGVLQRRNLVYCASTSAGKSFVAEILMLQRVLTFGKMALLVLPYVSICAEKAEHLEVLLEPHGKHVRSYYGNQGGGVLPKDTSVAVCTIEKANSLLNKLLEDGRLSEVGIIVIDELHMVGDRHRGYLLELMLTKLRYASGEGNSEGSSSESSGMSSGKADPAHGLQIVGMSATMPNVGAVADWLKAALYQTDFRPVPLEEYIKVGNTIYDKKMDIVRTIRKTADLGGKDPDHVVELCNEVVQEGHSVLIFCSSRKGCESTARHVSKFLKGYSVSSQNEENEFADITSALDALRRCPVGLDPVLEETLPSGVAYHHAGLTVEEREIIETCYRKGLVRVLTATSTLAAGVNLPARRVIFRQPRIGREFIDGTRYKQMAGRAGRTGIDTKGESVLLCRPEELKRIFGIINEDCPPLRSCLAEDMNGMTHAILEVVAGGIVQTANDINRYIVLDDLSRAREGFVLASDLHLVYLVTPINVDVEPNWETYYERFMELSALDQSVGNRVGVTEPFLMRMAHGAPTRTTKSKEKVAGLQGKCQNRIGVVYNTTLTDDQALRVCKRFYVALILSRLIQEAPVAEVCEAFSVARGMVQALQENAGRFASMVSAFCERLGWNDLESLVAKFQNRISFGVKAEIVELTTIPYVKGSRARALYKAGLRTPLSIAEASIGEVVKALFEKTSWTVQEGSAQRRMQMGVAKKIKNGARRIVLEKAEEARITAFSAFKSLGLSVPQFLEPPLSTSVGNRMGHGAAASPDNGTSNSSGSVGNTGKPSAEESPTDNIKIVPGGEKKFENTSDIDKVTSSGVEAGTLMSIEASVQNQLSATVGHSKDVNMVQLNELQKQGDRIVKSNETIDYQRQEEKKNPVCSGTKATSNKGPIHAINVPGGFDTFLDLWDSTSEFYFDVHYNNRSRINSSSPFEVHGIAICWENSAVYYVNLPKDLMWSKNKIKDSQYPTTSGDKRDWLSSDHLLKVRQRWDRISGIMRKKEKRKFTWNLKAQVQALKNPAVSLQRNLGKKLAAENNEFEVTDDSFLLLTPIFIQGAVDLCIVTWILWPDEERSSCPNLEKEVKKRLSNEAAAAANQSGRWKNQMRRAAHNGCCRRVAQIRALCSILWKLLISEELTEALLNIEIPLVNILADMEIWGIGVDMEGCLQARTVLAQKLRKLEQEAYKLAGMRFSLHTAAEISHVLYAHLKLPIPEKYNKGKKHPSTDKHCLDFLRDDHPIIPVIKEHRTLAKILNCTLGSICSLARISAKTHKHTLHGHWLQTSTATGRLSMEEPNLQCVEHMVVFKINNDGNKEAGPDCFEINARDFCIPTQENWLLLAADYSQIELRLMAHFSKDSFLIDVLSKPCGDVFKMIAAKWTGYPEHSVGSHEREQTKRLVYGILYGMGPNSLAEQLGCSPEDAREKIQSFKSSFPGVASWLHEVVAYCHKKGYVKTLKGRKRYLSKIKFGNSKEKSKAERQAVNSMCQGSAADIIKIAMINIYSVIAEGTDMPCSSSSAKEVDMPCSTSSLTKNFNMLKGRCRILLQVHDELVLEVDPSVLKEAASLLQMCMENAVSLLVSLHVKLKVGGKWGSMKPFQEDQWSNEILPDS